MVRRRPTKRHKNENDSVYSEKNAGTRATHVKLIRGGTSDGDGGDSPICGPLAQPLQFIRHIVYLSFNTTDRCVCVHPINSGSSLSYQRVWRVSRGR